MKLYEKLKAHRLAIVHIAEANNTRVSTCHSQLLTRLRT